MLHSLERLQLDWVDIVYAHRHDAETPMEEEIVRAFNHLINTGKAFYWGTSEWSAERINEANLIAKQLGLIGPVVEQPKYNLLWRHRFESEYAHIYGV
jgi:aryl-alcohol dehydrogenase-like predicted oxidoreductase